MLPAKDAGKESKHSWESFMDRLDTTSKRAVENPLTPVSRKVKVPKRFWGGGIPK